METKNMNITPPEGWEIDFENSKLPNVVFKPIEEKLPTKWEDLECISGYCVCVEGTILSFTDIPTTPTNGNTWPTKEEAEASIALAQLLQLRKAWIGDWKPDWDNTDVTKFCISGSRNKEIIIMPLRSSNMTLSFPTAQVAEHFLVTFDDLLKIAKPLL